MNWLRGHGLFVSLVNMILSVGLATQDVPSRAPTVNEFVIALRAAKATSAAGQWTDAAMDAILGLAHPDFTISQHPGFWCKSEQQIDIDEDKDEPKLPAARLDEALHPLRVAGD